MHRFYWLEPSVLAGCSRPGVEPGRHTPRLELLERDLSELHDHGIRALLTVTETPLPAEALAQVGIINLHLPVADFHPPEPAQLVQALAFIDRHRASGAPVAVHCLAGQGRTGTVLAAYLIRAGADPREAISAVRAVCPGAIEARLQEEALDRFGKSRLWLV